MRIDAVDLFYLRMPEVLDIGDGSQDVLLVRVVAGAAIGWGEAEASPLTSIASWIAPMSHSACHPLIDSVLGERIDSAADILAITRKVRANSFYAIIQGDLTLSGIEIALWDLLGKVKQEPVYRLLGYLKAERKQPYASVLFGNTAQETLEKALRIRNMGFGAVKFGWGSFGRGSVKSDCDQIHAAREGIGMGAHLMIDAGTAFGEDVQQAELRLPALSDAGVLWFEEPFAATALSCYAQLAKSAQNMRLAAGEGSHNPAQAELLVDYGGIGFVQIDTGYVGGIADAYRVAQYASMRGIQFVNHTFTSHSALSASLQPYAGLKDCWIAEYPIEAKTLCWELTKNKIEIGEDGMISVPEQPGIGIEINHEAVKKYVVEVEIRVAGQILYTTPKL